MNKPLVSVCITIYNGEKYIHNMMTCFLNQTLKECECILVDNRSEDDTYKIICEYQDKYPDRIRAIRTEEHYDFPGRGRYIAIKNARADYVYVCDVDDEIDVRGLEAMYNAAIKNKADVVYANADVITVDSDGNYGKPLHRKLIDEKFAKPSKAVLKGAEFWNKLVKKELFIKHGEIPDTIFEDVAYNAGMVSEAKTVCSIKDVVYYYLRSDEGASGGAGGGKVETTLYSIKAENFLLSHHDPKSRNEIEFLVAGRMLNNFNLRWKYSDYLLEHLKEHYFEFLKNDMINLNGTVIPKFNNYLKNMADRPIPNRIYLNGFTHDYTEEEIEYISDTAITHENEVIILSEENCDINENPIIKRMLEDGRIREAAKYFALKNIIENGGYFIDDCIKLNGCLNYCRYMDAFIGKEDSKEYNDHIFGGSAGNEIFSRILDSYNSEWLYEKEYTLAKRFKLILTSEYDVPYEFRFDKQLQGLTILTEQYFTVSGLARNLTEIDYRILCNEEEDFITVKRSTFRSVLDKAAPAAKASVNDSRYRDELMAIKESNTYKLALKFKKLGDGPLGPFLKKIFGIFRKKK